jgi:hypothetical protein
MILPFHITKKERNTCLKKNEYVELDIGPQIVTPGRVPNDGKSK